MFDALVAQVLPCLDCGICDFHRRWILPAYAWRRARLLFGRTFHGPALCSLSTPVPRRRGQRAPIARKVGRWIDGLQFSRVFSDHQARVIVRCRQYSAGTGLSATFGFLSLAGSATISGRIISTRCSAPSMQRAIRAQTIQHVTPAHVHILLEMAHQRCAHHMLPRHPRLLHLLSLIDQSHPAPLASRPRGPALRCLSRNYMFGYSCFGLCNCIHGNIHHRQLPLLRIQRPRLRVHNRLRFLCHLFYCLLPHVSAH